MSIKNYTLLPVATLMVTGNLYAAEPTDSVISLGEVIVTGASESVKANLLPYTVSVIGERHLEASGSPQVLTVLSGMVPSMFVTQRSVYGYGVSSSGGSGHIKLRGVGGDRASGVLMMVDAQPQFAGIYSHHVADFYGKEYVERVEVLRGPGSVLYGSNAMAGAINVITRHNTPDGVRTTLTTQYGSYNTWLSSLTNTVNIGRLSTLASLSYNRTDGQVDNFDFKQAEGYAKVNYRLSERWQATADYTLMNLHARDPIYPRLNDPVSTDIYTQSITRGEASLMAGNRYGSTSGAVRLYYSYGNHFVNDPRHFHSTDDRLGVIVYQNFNPWRGATATVGFDFDRYSGRIPVSGGKPHTPGSLSTLDRKTITEYSPYITLSQSFLNDRLSLNGGLRMANSNLFDTKWVPQGGFALNPGLDINIKGNISMGYRNPSFRELYLYRMANPDLQPEQMLCYELSLGRCFSRYFAADITAYYMRGSNLIETLDTKNRNTGSFINKGIEVSARSHLIDNLYIYATYSYLHTTLTNLTGAPVNQYYLGIDYTPLKPLNLCMDIKGVGGLYVWDDIPRQNYVVVNLKASYTLTRYLTLFVTLDNITATRYVINRGYDMPRLTALGGLKLTL